jgi:shikimate kinase
MPQDRDIDSSNVVLIGMPYAGKSTVGVLLAKAMSRDFLDTDVYIQVRQGRPLQAILDAEGLAGFCRIEEQCVVSLDCRRHVIATGGSVVYSSAAMAHLRASGAIVYLHLALPELEARVSNLDSRGVVMAPGQTLKDLYAERQGLYRAWADTIVDCKGKTHHQVVQEIVRTLAEL